VTSGDAESTSYNAGESSSKLNGLVIGGGKGKGKRGKGKGKRGEGKGKRGKGKGGNWDERGECGEEKRRWTQMNREMNRDG
jgi:hypothetical protein